MAGSVFGNIFKISTWGESHGEGLGVVIDGCPAGLPLCEEASLRKRRHWKLYACSCSSVP